MEINRSYTTSRNDYADFGSVVKILRARNLLHWIDKEVCRVDKKELFLYDSSVHKT